MTEKTPGLDRPKKKQTNRLGNPTLSRRNEAFGEKEPTHRTTINIPYSIYQELRLVWREQEIPMTDQLLDAWRQQTGWDAS